MSEQSPQERRRQLNKIGKRSINLSVIQLSLPKHLPCKGMATKLMSWMPTATNFRSMSPS